MSSHRTMSLWATAMTSLLPPLPFRTVAGPTTNAGIRIGRTTRRGQPGNKLAKKAAKGRIGIVTRGY